jgi:hypothetical protein
VSDQSGPLFRVTPPTAKSPVKVEQVDLEIGSSQGMLWAFDSLYVVVNSKGTTRESGLYRLRDTNDDDKLDSIKLLKSFKDRSNEGAGHGEHGPHAVVLGPDKKSLYIVAGNFTNAPEPLADTSPAKNWAEDQLLPRMADGKGHDPNINAPASWVCRTDKDGKTWELFAMGMRNAYDIAFNRDGELFTYDSDMEWDIGSPWYRPTRLNHLVSASDSGWRHGSGKFPVYYPDTLPSLLDVGVGSPTGVTFGVSAKFPAKYQHAYFAADWAYGKIFAVHMEPHGATYRATHETFIVGKPFAVMLDSGMTADQIIFGLAVFLLAGTVKGLVGLGLPTVVIALTTLVLPLTESIAMIALPTIFTNVWQAAVGGNLVKIVRRQWPLIVPLAIALYLTMWLVGQKGPNWAFIVLAMVLMVYSGLGLLRIRLHIHADLEKPLAPVIGTISGFVAGVVGVPIIPLMPYLQGLDVKPSELVQTLGVVLCATSLTLTFSLLNFGLLDGPRAVVSAAAVVPALAGMWLGQQIRQRLSVEQFRLAVFWALLLTGLYTFASRVL